MRLGSLVLGKRPVLVGVLTGFSGKGALRNALKIGIDAIEVRVDHFESREAAPLMSLLEGLRGKGLPVITTVRSSREGGKYPISDRERIALFSALMPLSDAVDIELSSIAPLNEIIRRARRSKKRVILSYHNFNSTPPKGRLERIIDRGNSEGGDIVKIATTVRVAGDTRRLASLTLDHKNLVTIAMGSQGAASRIFFPLLGSLLTYAPIGDATAPGQMSLKVTRRELNRYYL